MSGTSAAETIAAMIRREIGAGNGEILEKLNTVLDRVDQLERVVSGMNMGSKPVPTRGRSTVPKKTGASAAADAATAASATQAADETLDDATDASISAPAPEEKPKRGRKKKDEVATDADVAAPAANAAAADDTPVVRPATPRIVQVMPKAAPATPAAPAAGTVKPIVVSGAASVSGTVVSSTVSAKPLTTFTNLRVMEHEYVYEGKHRDYLTDDIKAEIAKKKLTDPEKILRAEFAKIWPTVPDSVKEEMKKIAGDLKKKSTAPLVTEELARD